jgi:hypothetical protein
MQRLGLLHKEVGHDVFVRIARGLVFTKRKSFGSWKETGSVLAALDT